MKIKYIGFLILNILLINSIKSQTTSKNTPLPTIQCGDLLERYLQKPENLEFLECKKVKHSQTIIKAVYRVSGKKSKEAEDFFVEKYGMGKLKIFSHTGWEPNGGAIIDIDELKKININYSIVIEMWGYARKEDPNDFRLLERDEVEYFTVIVSIMEV